MLLPLSWLKEFVDLEGITPEELETRLFESGFEVEEKKYLGEEINRCVVGQITKITKHPDSDHLQVCILNCGEQEGTEIQIVTGAQNVFEGALVPVALNGASLHGGVKIKNGKLRGVESNGMLCSGGELGITEDFFPNAGVDGILILPEHLSVGQDIKKVVGLDDWVFDISITANRPDSESIFGMAREISAILNRKIRQPQLIYNSQENYDVELNIKVEDEENCPKYLASIIDNIKVEPSPTWLRQRLIKCGINPINNVVDITNYVLLELGQPMHAFDYDLVSGHTLIARPAKDGEKLETLDEKVSTLNPKNLVIADAEKPLALAGIMGGKQSGVSDDTKIVALESAKFMRESVRKTSRALGIASDSSHRFEKGIDTFTTTLAMQRALNLFESLGAGRVTNCQKGFEKALPKNKEIVTTTEKLNNILGIEVETQTIVNILERLNFSVKENDGKLVVTAPEYRTDVEGAPDLAEEVIRIYGYKHITPKLLTDTHITKGGLNANQAQELRAKRTLAGLGFNEIVTYSFCGEKDLDLLKLPLDARQRNFIKIQNPLTEDIAIMKTTLVAGTLNIITKNFKKGVESGKLFEISNIYFPKEQPMVNLPQELKTLSLGVWGAKHNFFTLKGELESFAEVFGIKLKFEKTQKSFLHPYRSANILIDGEVVGFMGQVAYDISEKLSITENTFVAELCFEKLLKHFAQNYAYKAVPKHASISRDLSLLAQSQLTNAEIEEVIYAGSKKVSSVKLFDVYTGANMPEGFKSMTYNLVFESGEEAITHEEVDAQIKKILGRLQHMLGVTIRS